MTPKGSRPVRKAGWWAAMPTWLPDYLRNGPFYRINDKNQRISLKEKRTFEPDSFLPQAALRYVCERTPYSLCSVDQTTHFLLTLWNARGSYQKQSGASGGKCALTTTTSHSEAASETASKHEEGSHPPCTLNKSSSNMEANAHDSFNQKRGSRWHRDLFRLYWKRRSKASSHKPRVSAETIALIREMAKKNRLWGAERMRGE
jgi:hypothetical protein